MKKISRRSFIKATLATAAVGALAACGGETATDSSTTTSSSSVQTDSAAGAATNEYGFAIPTENVTIKFANHMVLETATSEFWENFKTTFETKYPTVTIEYVSAPYADIVTTVINMAGGGDIVDLMVGEAAWASTLTDTGLTAPVKSVMGDEYVADFLPGVLDAMTVDGEIYGLPMYMTPFVLYYNADILAAAGYDAPPTTYEEMLEMAPAIAELTSADGNKIYPFGQTTGAVAVSGTSLCAMAYNFGARVLSPEGELVTNSPEFQEAFETLALLDEQGYNPENALLKDLRNLFALGQVAMYYDQTWGFSGVVSINPDAGSYARTAAPLAGGTGSGDSVVSAHSVFIMNKDEKQQQAVALLVSEMITEETLGTFMTETNLAYPAKNSMASMEAIANSEILSGAKDCLDKAQAMPLVPAISDLYMEVATLAQAITVGDEDFATAYATFENAALGYLD